MKRRFVIFVILATFLITGIWVNSSQAIPTFARKYKTSCVTCHVSFPKLNSFGKTFWNNGIRYPEDDEEYVKEEPVSLGADAYKRVFPDAVWPADISGTSNCSNVL